MAKRASDIVQVKVRMRVDMHRKLEKEAERRGQTLNAEILRRLQDSLSHDSADFETHAFARGDIIHTLVTKTADATANALAATLGIYPVEWRLRHRDPDERAIATREAEEAAIKLLREQDPAIDEQAAREYVNELIEKYGSSRPETPEESRVRGVEYALRWIKLRKGRPQSSKPKGRNRQ